MAGILSDGRHVIPKIQKLSVKARPPDPGKPTDEKWGDQDRPPGEPGTNPGDPRTDPGMDKTPGVSKGGPGGIPGTA